MTVCAQIISASAAAFGTSGVRGLVEDLDDATCFAFTTAFLAHLTRAHDLTSGSRVWLGHDLRPSSPGIVNACAAAISAAGYEVVFCGVLPTPALAYSALQAGEPAVMVTGSHIPFDRNGIKFYRGDGEMLKEDEGPVLSSQAPFPAQRFDGNDLITPARIEMLDRAANAWHDRYMMAFGGMLDGLRIGHYQHSAAGRDLLAQLLQSLGAVVVPLGRSDTFVPIDTEAVAKTDRDQAVSWVSEHRLDALVSTDGDGDRPLLGDENGRYFRGDTLGILAARALGVNAIVTPVSSTSAVETSGWFDAVHRTKIGSPHVIATMASLAMQEGQYVAGFEANGGFLTASVLKSPWNDSSIEPLATRDALLPVLATLALAKDRNVPLSKLHDLPGTVVTASGRLENVAAVRSQDLISRLKGQLQRAQALSPNRRKVTGYDQTDGLRMSFDDGSIIHLRASGNAPELRVYVEAWDGETAAALLAHALENVRTLLS